MHFYPSMAFFERGRPLEREAPKTGQSSETFIDKLPQFRRFRAYGD